MGSTAKNGPDNSSKIIFKPPVQVKVHSKINLDLSKVTKPTAPISFDSKNFNKDAQLRLKAKLGLSS